ncbi:unnamed protein product [Rhodiola kirilowii]
MLSPENQQPTIIQISAASQTCPIHFPFLIDSTLLLSLIIIQENLFDIILRNLLLKSQFLAPGHDECIS